MPHLLFSLHVPHVCMLIVPLENHMWITKSRSRPWWVPRGRLLHDALPHTPYGFNTVLTLPVKYPFHIIFQITACPPCVAIYLGRQYYRPLSNYYFSIGNR